MMTLEDNHKEFNEYIRKSNKELEERLTAHTSDRRLWELAKRMTSEEVDQAWQNLWDATENNHD